MTNYLTYLGLGCIGYFFGFKFIFLCNAIYNAFYYGNKMNYYNLFMMYLLYSMGFLGTMHTLVLIFIYNFLSNYDDYMTKIRKITEEYNNFMKFYDEEIIKDPSKSSKLVEYWKIVLDKYNVLMGKYNNFMNQPSSNKYYTLISNLLSYRNSIYVATVNQKIHDLFITIIQYFKLDSHYYSLTTELSRINTNLQDQRQTPNSPSQTTPQSTAQFPTNFNEMLNMEELDNLLKMGLPKNENTNFPSLDEFIASLDEIKKIDTGSSLKKRKKKIFKKPPPQLNKK